MNTLSLLIDTLIDDNVLSNDLVVKSDNNNNDTRIENLINSFYRSIRRELNHQIDTILNKLESPKVAEQILEDINARRQIIEHVSVNELTRTIKQNNKDYIREIYENGYKHGSKQLGIEHIQFGENTIRGLKYVQNNSYNRIRNLNRDVQAGVREAILETCSKWC